MTKLGKFVLNTILFFLTSVFLFSTTSPALAWEELDPPAPIKEAPAPFSIMDAKLSLGYPETMARLKLSQGSSKIKFAIIDTGFEGLDQWLEAHPEEKKHTHYISMDKEGKKLKGTHGYNIYRIARKVLSFGDIYLIDKTHTDADTLKALGVMVKNSVYMGTYSQGKAFYYGKLNGEGDFGNKKKILNILNKYEITLFQASANDRDNVHFFPFLDKNSDKVLEFVIKAPEKYRSDLNYIKLKKGWPVQIELSWNEYPNKISNFELQLVGDKKILAKSDSFKKKFPALNLKYKPEKDMWAAVKLISKEAVNKESLRFNLYVGGAYLGKGFFNGYGRTSILSKLESPFLISVGSYGMDKSNKLAPSAFSSHGQTIEGRIIPHILGPGQIKLDDMVINGTSYSTPFLASLYGFFGQYNIKNMIEATTSHDPLKQGLSKAERSRWGVPVFTNLTSRDPNINPCTTPDEITNISHEIKEKSVVISFNYSRKCMEGLSYYPTVALKGNILNGNHRVMTKLKRHDKPKQPLRNYATYKNTNKNIENQRVEVSLPLGLFKRSYYGVDLEPVFLMRTKAMWDPFKIGINIPEYRFRLPEPKPLGEKYKGTTAYKTIPKALELGLDKDVIDLATRAITSDEIKNEQAKGYTFWKRGIAHMRVGDPIKAQKDFLAALKTSYQAKELTADLAMSYFIQGNFMEAEKLFATLDTDDKSGFMPGMYRFLANLYLGKNTTERLKANPWGLEMTTWPGALAGLYLNKIHYNDVLKLVVKEKSMDKKFELNSRAGFFIGELAAMSKNKKVASQMYNQVRISPVVDDHSYWAVRYMNKK